MCILIYCQIYIGNKRENYEHVNKKRVLSLLSFKVKINSHNFKVFDFSQNVGSM